MGKIFKDTLTHTSVTFRMPQGQGENIPIVIDLDGRKSQESMLFNYDPPLANSIVIPRPPRGPTSGCIKWESKSSHAKRLDSIDPLALRKNPLLSKRNCEEPAKIVINGSSFGYRDLSVSVGPYTAATLCANCKHGHYELTVQSPPGIGTDHAVVVRVGARVSQQILLFSYLPASVREAIPGSVHLGN